MCVCARANKVRVSELREIAPVASLGQIIYIGSDRTRKLQKDYAREQRKIKERERTREKFWSLRITQNRTSSIIRPNK